MRLLKTLAILALSAFSCSVAFAASVNKETAQSVALNFMKKYANQTKTVKSVDCLYYQENVAQYVINFENGGWIIVSADNVVNPIVGYNKTGYFDVKKEYSDGLKGLLNNFGYDIVNKSTESGSLKSSKKTSVQKKWDDLLNPSVLKSVNNADHVDNILVDVNGNEFIWNQKEPYNYTPYLEYEYHPRYDVTVSRWYYTGCTPTALSMIMAKWQWPANIEFTDTSDYKTYRVGFDWSQITSELPFDLKFGTVTETSNLLGFVGKVLQTHYIGLTSGWDNLGGYTSTTEYERTVSNQYYGTYTAQPFRTRIKKLGYDCTPKISRSSLYSLSSSITSEVAEEYWESMIKTELKSGRPVYYEGCMTESDGTKSAHSYLVTGFDENNLFYINWGWRGDLNGNYSLSTGSDTNYQEDAAILLGLSPKYPTSDVCYDLPSETVESGEKAGAVAKEYLDVPCQKTLTVKDGAELNVSAGKSISFNEGFKAEQGSTVKAKINKNFAVDHKIHASILNCSNGSADISVSGANSYLVLNYKVGHLTSRSDVTKTLSFESNALTDDGSQTIHISNVSGNSAERFFILLMNNYGDKVYLYGRYGDLNFHEGVQSEDWPISYWLFNGLPVDGDGRIAASSGADQFKSSVVIAPTVTSDIVNVSVGSELSTITVCDITGAVVSAAEGVSGDYQINLSGKHKGVYTVTVRNNQNVVTEKVILK